MRQIRIHTPQPLVAGNEVELDPHATEHVARVLRMRVGDALVLFNGDGRDCPAILTRCDKRSVTARIGSTIEVHLESPLRITLAQALISGHKMDLVIQKAVELGVHAIVPVATERATVQLDARRAGKRMAHWQAVVAGACEQCGRSTMPRVAPLQGLHDWTESLPDDGALRLALLPGAVQRVRDLAPAAAGMVLAIGPEGGFSRADSDCLDQAGFSGLSLGSRILRTETAGLAALAALQAVHGDG